MTATPFRFDHLVIAVDDLDRAVSDYTQLRFQVSTGGRHTHAPTRNALVYLPDGAYLELIEWLAPAYGEKWFEQISRRGHGIVDFALCPPDFAAYRDGADGRYHAYQAPVAGSRVQPDGTEIRWLLGWPLSGELPFLCADVTPRRLRVPEGPCREQPNRVTGIVSVALQVTDIDAAIAAYENLLGCRAERSGDTDPYVEQLGLTLAMFELGATRLYLVAPRQGSAARGAAVLADDLAAHGSRVYRVNLAVDGAQGSQRLDTALTHGATLWIGPQSLPLHTQVDPRGG